MIITAYDFGKPTGANVPFGIERSMLSAALHKLADAVAREECYPQNAEVSSKASGEEFVMTTLTLTYAEKVHT